MSRVLSIRVPDTLYEQLKAIAVERKQSINRLANEALQQLVKQDERQKLYDAFTYLGQRFGSRIEHTLPMQRKMMAERQVCHREQKRENDRQ